MTDLEKKYAAYRTELRKLQEQRDAWYTIASQKFSEGDEKGQAKAYREVDAITKKIMSLEDPREDELLGGGDQVI